jgi:SAM-dependent methyltransferase
MGAVHRVTPPRPPWNNNIHYHALIARALPTDCRRVLDVGCGEGILTRSLAQRVPEAIGIDVDRDVLARASERDLDRTVTWVVGDFLMHPFEPGSFDAVVSVAVLHHVDAAAGLRRMADLVRPGGVVAVIGLARRSWPRDLPLDLLGAAASRLYQARRGRYPQGAPPMSYHQIRGVVRATLPGADFRRRLLLRYSVSWRKPPAQCGTPQTRQP